MPLNNCDPASTFVNALAAESCPRCGAEMEPIASAVKDLPLRELHLCPECYLVTWTDASGFQVRQGVPVKDGHAVASGSGKPN